MRTKATILLLSSQSLSFVTVKSSVPHSNSRASKISSGLSRKNFLHSTTNGKMRTVKIRTKQSLKTFHSITGWVRILFQGNQPSQRLASFPQRHPSLEKITAQGSLQSGYQTIWHSIANSAILSSMLSSSIGFITAGIVVAASAWTAPTTSSLFLISGILSQLESAKNASLNLKNNRNC